MKKGEAMSDEQKNKIGKANFGKKCSEETKKKISETKRGRKLSKNHKKKISEGLKNSEKHQIGVRSENRKNKLRKANLGKKLSKETKLKQSIKRKKYFLKKENRTNMQQKSKDYWSKPKNREEQSKKAKQRFKDNPELKIKMKEYRARKKPMTDEQKKERSRKMIGHIGYNKGTKLSEKSKKLIGKKSKERWANSDYYNRVMPKIKMSMKKMWQNEDYIKKMAKLKKMANTNIEIKIQNFLNKLNIKFIPQHRIKDIKNSYLSDIFIPSKKLVIECDGDYWHNYPDGNEIDHIRTGEMLNNNYKVLRLWERDIKKMSLDDFKEKIVNGIQ